VNDRFVEDVLSAVEQVPAGTVVTYGDLAAFVGRGGPRQVGQVMAVYGSSVCWWRVVRSDGRPARGHEEPAVAHLTAENTPLRAGRVDLDRARHALRRDPSRQAG